MGSKRFTWKLKNYVAKKYRILNSQLGSLFFRIVLLYTLLFMNSVKNKQLPKNFSKKLKNSLTISRAEENQNVDWGKISNN